MRPTVSVLPVALLLGIVGARAASPPADLSASDLFQMYASGRFDAADQALLGQLHQEADVSRFERDLHSHIGAWPSEQAAAFALEATVVAVDALGEHPAAFARSVPTYAPEQDAGSLPMFTAVLDDGLGALGRGTPLPFARLWGLTAIALWTGPPNDLRGSDTALSLHPASMAVRAVDALERKFDKRLENDPAMALAWGVNREAAVQAWLYSWGVQRRMSPDRKIIKAPWSAEVYSWLDHARSAFEIARRDPSLAQEAALRTGLVDLYQGHLDQALRGWSSVAGTTSDVTLKYLAALFTGRALAAVGRHDEAEAAYRDAVALQPAAQSARTGLAALLYVSGRPIDAGRLVQPLITASDPAPDPWWSYTDNHFETHLLELRRALH